MIKRFPRTQAEEVILGGPLYNRLVSELERASKFTVAPPLEMIDTASGKQLTVRIPPAGDTTVLVRPTSFTTPSALGGGKYWGYIQRRIPETFFVANSTNLDMSDFYEDEPDE